MCNQLIQDRRLVLNGLIIHITAGVGITQIEGGIEDGVKLKEDPLRRVFLLLEFEVMNWQNCTKLGL